MTEPHTAVEDEYLHEPEIRRLWKESYFFEFNAPAVQGFARLGFQPFERRANAWFYLVHDGRTIWFYDQNIPIERTFGIQCSTETFDLAFDPIDPYEEWSLSVSGVCSVSADPWEVLTGTDKTADVEFDVGFSDPYHSPYPMNLLVDTDDHYEHAGRFQGQATVEGTTVPVDAVGYRDHSWGWFRDWTPGEWGHYWLGAQFDTRECVSIMAQIRPDGGVRKTFGYQTDGEAVVPLEDVAVDPDDGLDRDERARAWAAGDYPDEITFTVQFKDEVEEIICRSLANVPIGFEDRNGALTDPDGPWLKTVYSRLPVEVEWGTKRGRGWADGVHPL